MFPSVKLRIKISFIQSWINELIDYDSFCVSRYLPLIRKNFVTYMHGLAVYVK